MRRNRAEPYALSHALAYAGMGWPVLPLRAGAKLPATAHGYKDATTDPDTIRQWFEATPRAGVGIHPGPARLLALDVDDKDGKTGNAQLEALEATHGPIPPTLVQRTPSGGRHVLLKLPDGVVLGNGHLPGAPHIDIRAHGGYIAATPTRLAMGAYAFEGWDATTGEAPHIADAPAWLLALLVPGGVPTEQRQHVGETMPVPQLEKLVAAVRPSLIDTYEGWVSVGAALYHLTEGAPEGLELWERVSADARGWDGPEPLAARWDGFARDVGVRAGRGTLEALADPESAEWAAYMADGFEDVSAQAGLPSLPSFKSYTLVDLMARDLGEPVWWWDGYIPAGEVTLLAAHGATGKSTLALQLAFAVATGRSFLGRATRPGRVLFFSGEDPVMSPHFQTRARRVLSSVGGTSAEAGDRLRIEDGTADPTLVREARTGSARVASPTRGYAELQEAIRAHRADLVIVDNASDTFDGDEIARAQVRAFVRFLADLVRGTGGAVLLLAHVSKASAKGATDGEDYSGSTAWHNSVRSRLHLREVENKARVPGVRTLELLHGKSTHGLKLPPLPLIWAEGGTPALDEGADTSTDAPLRGLVRTIAEFNARGERVPAASRGPDTTQSTLGREAPADLRDVLRDGERRGWLHRVTHRLPPKYAERAFWEATTEGLRNASPAPVQTDMTPPAEAHENAL